MRERYNQGESRCTDTLGSVGGCMGGGGVWPGTVLGPCGHGCTLGGWFGGLVQRRAGAGGLRRDRAGRVAVAACAEGASTACVRSS